jgi:hypothetical protein
MTDAWARLGRVAPGDLAPARVEIHHAAQIASAVGATLLPRREDDSHTNLEWIPEQEAFGGNPVAGARLLRGALRPRDLTLMLLDGGGQPVGELALSGRTLDDGYAWMAEAIGAAGGPGSPLGRPAYDLPGHPVARGGRFSEPMESYGEIGRWYGNAAALLERMKRDLAEASPIRCWPHHFDIAILQTVAPGKTVGVGLSPGDESYGEPYWYVGPSPYPEQPNLAPLPERGRWHTDGFFAAVLTGSDLLAGESDRQRERAELFLRAAHAACLDFL